MTRPTGDTWDQRGIGWRDTGSLSRVPRVVVEDTEDSRPKGKMTQFPTVVDVNKETVSGPKTYR